MREANVNWTNFTEVTEYEFFENVGKDTKPTDTLKDSSGDLVHFWDLGEKYALLRVSRNAGDTEFSYWIEKVSTRIIRVNRSGVRRRHGYNKIHKSSNKVLDTN